MTVVGRRLHLEVVGADARDVAHGQAGVLGRVEGADVVAAAVDEVVGAAAVETLLGVGHEEVPRAARWPRAGRPRPSSSASSSCR
jgi:hypothetical protein